MSEFDGTALELALARQQLRAANQLSAAPVQVRSLHDIHRVIAEFAPGNQRGNPAVPIQAVLRGEVEGGKVETFRVRATSTTKSRRDIIIDGLEVIGRYYELVEQSCRRVIPISVDGTEMSPPLLQQRDPTGYVDPLIRRWMGAYRKGLRICWDLPDGFTYLYDIFEHKLSRIKRED